MNVCPILLLEKEGVFLFYCMYLIKFASKRSSVLEMSASALGSGTMCVVKFWLSLWLLESNLFNIQIASRRSSAKDSLHNL